MKIELWSVDSVKTFVLELSVKDWPQVVLFKNKCYMRYNSRPYELREVKDCHAIPYFIKDLGIAGQGDFVSWDDASGKTFEGSVISMGKDHKEPFDGVEVFCTDGVTRIASSQKIKKDNTVMVKVYALDVDECLEISNGPVTLASLLELREQGHVVGLCGNGRKFCDEVPEWWKYISFVLNYDLGPVMGFQGIIGKDIWMRVFKETFYLHAEEYIMVGNEFGRVNSLGHKCGSHDSWFAELAGWRFILEDDFANGNR